LAAKPKYFCLVLAVNCEIFAATGKPVVVEWSGLIKIQNGLPISTELIKNKLKV
jgi:hypothetical protein